ncbi:MAG: chromate transporter [Comamonas sp.]
MDWLHLFAYFLSLSLMAVGGAIATAPDMHRFLVDSNRWLTEPQFTSSIAIAQAAPGPNVLFIALLGWNVGLNAGGGTGPLAWALGALGVATCMVRAFKQGMAPLVIGLLLATGWLLGSASGNPATDWKLWLLSGVSTLLVWRTRIHLLWLLGAGALLGAFALV